jgi:hypothetical protein
MHLISWTYPRGSETNKIICKIRPVLVRSGASVTKNVERLPVLKASRYFTGNANQ